VSILIRIGLRVRILSGPFKGKDGSVKSIDRNGVATVFLGLVYTRVSIAGHDLRIAIREDYRGKWWLQCDSAGLNSILDAKTAKQARHEAIQKVQERLERMLAELHQIKAVTL
jgi:hypothetical protein